MKRIILTLAVLFLFNGTSFAGAEDPGGRQIWKGEGGHVFHTPKPGTTFANILIDAKGYDIGIKIDQPGTYTFDNVWIKNATSYGIEISGEGVIVEFDNGRIFQNKVHGILLQDHAVLTVKTSEFDNNGSPDADCAALYNGNYCLHAIHVRTKSNLTSNGNTYRNNGGAGIFIDSHDSITHSKNDKFSDNSLGIRVVHGSHLYVDSGEFVTNNDPGYDEQTQYGSGIYANNNHTFVEIKNSIIYGHDLWGIRDFSSEIVKDREEDPVNPENVNGTDVNWMNIINTEIYGNTGGIYLWDGNMKISGGASIHDNSSSGISVGSNNSQTNGPAFLQIENSNIYSNAVDLEMYGIADSNAFVTTSGLGKGNLQIMEGQKLFLDGVQYTNYSETTEHSEGDDSGN